MSFNYNQPPNFKKKKKKGFDPDKAVLGTVIGAWVLGSILFLAFWGFIAWVVVQLLQHFGVI